MQKKLRNLRIYSIVKGISQAAFQAEAREPRHLVLHGEDVNGPAGL